MFLKVEHMLPEKFNEVYTSIWLHILIRYEIQKLFGNLSISLPQIMIHVSDDWNGSVKVVGSTPNGIV